MRTSGVESDVLLFLVPVVVLTVLTVIFLGGPAQTIELIDSSVIDMLRTLRSRW